MPDVGTTCWKSPADRSATRPEFIISSQTVRRPLLVEEVASHLWIRDGEAVRMYRVIRATSGQATPAAGTRSVLFGRRGMYASEVDHGNAGKISFSNQINRCCVLMWR